jgi:Cu/Ag efflux protein CusF
MPPMTMSFTAKDPAMLKGFKEGDKVRFRAAEVKGNLTVVSIEAAK